MSDKKLLHIDKNFFTVCLNSTHFQTLEKCIQIIQENNQKEGSILTYDIECAFLTCLAEISKVWKKCTFKKRNIFKTDSKISMKFEK